MTHTYNNFYYYNLLYVYYISFYFIEIPVAGQIREG